MRGNKIQYITKMIKHDMKRDPMSSPTGNLDHMNKKKTNGLRCTFHPTM